MPTLSFADWLGLVTVVFLVISFLQRMKLARKEDLADIKVDMTKILEQVTKTNGRVTDLEGWRKYVADPHLAEILAEREAKRKSGRR